jgi:hypothetical protein
MLGGAGASGATAAGTGGTGAGTGGSAAGSGASGMGGGAGMGSGSSFAGCEAANTSAAPAMLHSEALAVLNPQSPCGFGSCHAGTNGKAMLVLNNVMDLRTLLVGKMSCQVPTMPLVDGAGGQAALTNSWLWQKLTAPSDSSGVIMGNMASWGAGVNCGQMGGQPYGLRMPWTNTDMPLEEARLAAVRNWICAGAPGP